MLLLPALLHHAAFLQHAPPALLTPRRNPPQIACCDFEALSVQVQVQLESGAVELVTLDAANTPDVIVAELAARHELSKDQMTNLEDDLIAQWDDASLSAPPIYVGPMPENNQLSDCLCSLELEAVGLALEVADSVAVEKGGRGLFVRCIGDVESVTLDEGTAICGYAQGAMRDSADSDGERSVGFALADLESVVWFEQALHAVGDLLADETIDAIAGHIAQYDELSGQPISIAIDPTYEGPRYFVPDAEQPEPLSIGVVGQMANDLAIKSSSSSSSSSDEEAEAEQGTTEEAAMAYEEASENSNLLCLAFRLERDARNPRLLVPSRPISTLAKSVTFVNDVPMELGCHYGSRYWRNREAAAMLESCLELPGGEEQCDAPGDDGEI